MPNVSTGRVEFAQHLHRNRIVGIENRDRVRVQVFEDSPLGLAVIFQRAVPVEVVPADVRDAGRIERDAGQRLPGQIAARNLHDRVRRADGRHLGERAGQHGRRQRAIERRAVFEAVPVAERIERADRCAGFAEDRGQQPCDGRFAVRAGDADDFHLPRRIADQCLAQPAVGDAAVGHDTLRHVENRQRPLANHRDGAATDRGSRMIVAIVVVARDRDVHVARLNLSPIARAARGAKIGRAIAAQLIRQQFAERDSGGCK